MKIIIECDGCGSKAELYAALLHSVIVYRYRVDQRVVGSEGDWRFVEYLDEISKDEALRHVDKLREKAKGEWEFRLMRLPDIEWHEVEE